MNLSSLQKFYGGEV